MARLIDGRRVALRLKERIVAQVSALPEGMKPGLAVVLVGDDPASQIYVRHKVRACSEVGMVSRSVNLPSSVSEETLLGEVRALNEDRAIHGILVQLPLPKSINARVIIEEIAPEKDVDGFHPNNVGLLAIGFPRFLPCTPYGILHLLEHYDISLPGQRCVVVGASNIVGRPLAVLLQQRGATVTVCNSLTRDLPSVTRTADILVSATGCPGLISGDSVAEGVVVVDVGIHRCADGRVVGDVDFDACFSKASYITPVPGGVGPMTIAMLLKNTLQAMSFAGE